MYFPVLGLTVQVEISGVPFTSPNFGQVQISAEQYDQLLQGLWYVNVHTTENMDGEVRGQLVGFEGSSWRMW